MSQNMWCVMRLLPGAPAILDVIPCKTGGRPFEIRASENNIYLSSAHDDGDYFFTFSFFPLFCWLDSSRTSLPPLEGRKGHQTAQTL